MWWLLAVSTSHRQRCLTELKTKLPVWVTMYCSPYSRIRIAQISKFLFVSLQKILVKYIGLGQMSQSPWVQLLVHFGPNCISFKKKSPIQVVQGQPVDPLTRWINFDPIVDPKQVQSFQNLTQRDPNLQGLPNSALSHQLYKVSASMAPFSTGSTLFWLPQLISQPNLLF